MTVREIRKELRKLRNKEKAKFLQGFFKTGPGEYGEGDVFLGIKVPELRKIARTYREITLEEVETLLHSEIHEERLLALLILIFIYNNGGDYLKSRIHDFYLKNTKYINNWDLVDLSAQHIVGEFLMDKSRKPLYGLAKSALLWDRRIAIIATFYFIKQDEFSETLKIAKMLLKDKEDLIHKAVGWMLREIGKRHMKTEEGFLKEHYEKIPRTMLRYAIEKFPEKKRQRYLKGKV